MPPDTRTPARLRARTAERTPTRREVILREAARLFTERGYQATTINNIGEAVGITGPGLYRHFESKQAVLVALIDETAGDFFDSASRIVDDAADAAEMIDRLVRLNVEVILDHRELNAAYWLEGAGLAGSATVNEDTARYLGLWRDAVGRIRPDLRESELEVLAEAVLWLMRSTSFFDSSLPRPELDHLLVQIALGAIHGNDAAKSPSAASTAASARGIAQAAHRARTPRPRRA